MYLPSRAEELFPGYVGSLIRVQPVHTTCVLLAIAGGLAHLPFVRSTPVNWDGVQFALALDKFDLHNHQPHPPGYILYVVFGQFLNFFVHSPGLALSLLSVVFSTLCAPLFYLMCLSVLEERGMALGATLLLMGSPLVLYYGSVGLTYVPEMTFSIVVAWLAWTVRRNRSVGTACLLGLALGVAGGLRQTSLPLLLPLCVWALWGAGHKRVAAFLGTLAVTCTLWLVPLLVLSGGVDAYMRESMLLGIEASETTSLLSAGLTGVWSNLTLETLGLLSGMGLALVPLVLWAARLLRFSVTRRLWLFIFWWAAPPLLFFALVHIGQLGYVLVALPALLMLSALSMQVLIKRLLNRDEKRAEQRMAMLCFLLGVASGMNFLVGDGVVTASSIDANSKHWNAVQQALSKEDPATTALVSESEWAGPFRQAGYLLPHFHLYAYGDGANHLDGWLYSAYGRQSTYSLPTPPAVLYLQLPVGTDSVIALDKKSADKLSWEEGLQNVALDDGTTLYKLHVQGAQLAGLRFKGEFIEVVRTR